MGNVLFFGDNLRVLRDEIADASVDLIYLDPPFNSAANYNVLFRAPDGRANEGSIEAFEDTWHWGDSAADAYEEVLCSGHSAAATLLRAMRGALGENDMMAYLAMMAVRLIELHRVLKPTGSLYLHCDPTASHYLKLLLDGVFGGECFVNEISWRRTTAKADHVQGATHFPRLRDVLLRYRRNVNVRVTYNQILNKYSDEHIIAKYSNFDSSGRRYRLSDMTGPGGAAKGNPSYEVLGVTRFWRYSKARMDQFLVDGLILQSRPGVVPRLMRYLDEESGVALGDDWDDIRPINSQAQERLGYPTQKPLALLERIIAASSNPGDVVLDPFCGCGTAVHAAEKLGRRWIGIDLTHLAVSLIERRMKDAFPTVQFEVKGTPQDLAGARDLALRDKYQFQWWAISLLDAVPQGGKKKGADRGIDGIRWVRTGLARGDVGPVLISVKGGENVSVRDVRDLVGTVEREKALGGILVTLVPPTKDMLREAASHGFFDYGLGRSRKIMVKTVLELMRGVHDDNERLPPLGRNEGFRSAPRERQSPEQTGLKF